MENLEKINWEEPNLLIGGGTPQEKIILTAIDAETQKILAIINKFYQEKALEELKKSLAEAESPVGINFLLSIGEREKYIFPWPNKNDFLVFYIWQSERDYKVAFDRSNPYRWQFVPTSYLPEASDVHKVSDIEQWGWDRLSGELARWALIPRPTHPSEKFLEPIANHYSAVFLWLRLHQMNAGEAKDKLREILYHTDLISAKPYADLSLACREFAYQLYPRSPLAQRAASEDHLWLCMEYSAYLHKKIPPKYRSKDGNRTATTDRVKIYRKAIKEGYFPDALEAPEKLHDSGTDWRLFINDLLLQEAVRLIWEDGSDFCGDLKFHTRRYLNAISHFNGIVGHQKGHVIGGTKRFEKKSRKTPKARIC